MKRLSQWLAVAGVASSLLLGVSSMAQDDQNRGGRGRGGFSGDPAEFQKMRMERHREDLEIKDDGEWKAIEPLITKVMEAQRDSGGGMRGFFGRNRGGNNNNNGGGNGGGDQNRRRFGPEPSAAEQALDKAIESNSKEEIKSAMAKVRAEKKEKEAKLTAAQDELKKVLSTKQEAIALTVGLIK